MRHTLPTIFATLLSLHLVLASATGADDAAPFEIRVVDAATGRGVPLVELRTTTGARYYSDNAGRVAFDEPGLMNRRVFFYVSSHGYQHPADGFGYRGRALDINPGESAEIEIERLNVAERMYRVTGYGLFRDSVLLGYVPPLAQPLLNAGVVGQDSVQSAVYNGKIYWFWGDTSRPEYPLGNFRTSGATSPLPEHANVHHELGIELTYFTDGDFVRPMTPLPSDEGNLMWISGLVTVSDGDGSEKLVAHYDHRAGLGEAVSQGLLVWNDIDERFDILQPMPLEEQWRRPIGQATRWKENGDTYLLFVRPWPTVRVADDFAAVQDRDTYEAFTCLEPGAEFAGADSRIERDAEGQLVWDWKRDTQPIDQQRERELIDAGLVAESEARFQLHDVETGDSIQVHRSAVNWNDHLGQWVQIATQVHGRSHLGEIWFAHAGSPTGPWRWARRIVTHDAYSFYNPAHHTFLDEQGGRFIYFEATYTNQFAGGTPPTPYYDYNQIMYRLDVDQAQITEPPELGNGSEVCEHTSGIIEIEMDEGD